MGSLQASSYAQSVEPSKFATRTQNTFAGDVRQVIKVASILLSSAVTAAVKDRLIPFERIIGAVVYPASEIVSPGVVRVIEGNRFTLGELDGAKTDRVRILSEVLTKAGFKSPVSTDIRGEIFLKLWGNVVFNPVSALTHATLEDIARFPQTRALAETIMTETRAVAEKLGVRIRISIDKRIAGAAEIGAHKTSMLQDVEAGRELELSAIVGGVVEMARLTETPTPALEAVYACTSLLAKTLADANGRLAVQPRP